MLLVTMRLFYVSFLAAKLILSTALMSGDPLEAPLDGGGLPYDLAANSGGTQNTEGTQNTGGTQYPEGTRCDVIGVRLFVTVRDLELIFVEKLGIAFWGIRLRRDQCHSGLSVLGDSFEADTHAQSWVPDCEHSQPPAWIRAIRSHFDPHIMLIAINPGQTCRKSSAALT